MSYVVLKGLGPEQRSALNVSPDELRALSPEIRLDYALRHEEVKARKHEAFWTAAATLIPIFTFLGLQRVFK